MTGNRWALPLPILLALAFGILIFSPVLPILKFLAKGGVVAVLGVSGFGALGSRILGPNRTRQALLNVSVAAVAIALSLAAGEAATRWIFRGITTTGDNSGYFSKRWKGRDPPTLNRWGFRERDFAVPAPDGIYRIAVIGDSITYGQGIQDDERMTPLLEARLNEAKGGFEVLNFGRSGAETIDEIEILRDVVLHVDADFLLVQWYPNDVEGRDKSGRPQLAHLAPRDVLHGFLWDHSALYVVAQIGWTNLLGRLGLAGSYLTYMDSRFLDPSAPDWQLYEQQLKELIELSLSRRLPVGILLYPSTSAFARGAYALGYPHDRVLAICARYRITCVDLRQMLTLADDIRSLQVSSLDAHPSPFANRQMTEAVLRAFAQAWGVAR